MTTTANTQKDPSGWLHRDKTRLCIWSSSLVKKSEENPNPLRLENIPFNLNPINYYIHLEHQEGDLDQHIHHHHLPILRRISTVYSNIHNSHHVEFACTQASAL